MSYYRDVYLKSDHWRNLRLERLRIDPKCVFCGVSSLSNDVHHVSYAENLWDVKAKDLRVLCRQCHNEVHRVMDNEPHIKLAPKQRRWSLAFDLIVDRIAYNKSAAETERMKAGQRVIDGLWLPLFLWCKNTASPWATNALVFWLSKQHQRELDGLKTTIEHNRARLLKNRTDSGWSCGREAGVSARYFI